MTKITPIFLTAAWRHLIMLNFEVDPGLLKPYIPKGTELDYWQDKTYRSIIGLVFYNTRIKGLAIPFHQTFEELNLRFYVRRPGPEGINRGVVFIKELVRKPAIALMARVFYNEEYVALYSGREWKTAKSDVSLEN